MSNLDYKTIIKILETVPTPMKPLVLFAGATSALGYNIWGKIDGLKEKQKDQEEQMKVLKARYEEQMKAVQARFEAQDDRIKMLYAKVDDLSKENVQLRVENEVLKERWMNTQSVVQILQQNFGTFQRFKLINEVMEKQKQDSTWRKLFSNIFASNPNNAEKIFREMESDFRKGK